MYEELFVRYSGIHGRYRPFGVGLVLLGSGVVKLWFDFLGPIVLKKMLEYRDGGKGPSLTAAGKARRKMILALFIRGKPRSRRA